MHDMKFKVWDKEKGCWFNPIFKAYAREIEELLLTPEGELILRRYDKMEHESLFPNRFEKVWYTGLKDKNGREIYESDIISGIRNQNLEVVYHSGAFGVFVKMRVSFHTDERKPIFTTLHCYESEEIEVIGNIYDNKDLLEIVK